MMLPVSFSADFDSLLTGFDRCKPGPGNGSANEGSQQKQKVGKIVKNRRSMYLLMIPEAVILPTGFHCAQQAGLIILNRYLPVDHNTIPLFCEG